MSLYDESTYNRIMSKCKQLKTGCLEWRGFVNKSELLINYQSRKVNVRRLLIQFATGSVPSGRVHTTCGNPLCCNIDHLQYDLAHTTSTYSRSKQCSRCGEKFAMYVKQHDSFCPACRTANTTHSKTRSYRMTQNRTTHKAQHDTAWLKKHTNADTLRDFFLSNEFFALYETKRLPGQSIADFRRQVISERLHITPAEYDEEGKNVGIR